MGNEYVFEALAEQNVETLNETASPKIVTRARTASTRSRTSTRLRRNYEVVHHWSFWPSWCARAGSRPRGGDKPITYHDSCYLARHNDVIAEPRELVAAVGKPVEMERSGQKTFCCGAGGAHMWMEERGTQINEERVRQAAETGADTLAVACPYCTIMLDDGVRTSDRDLRVVDVATLLAESLDDA